MELIHTIGEFITHAIQVVAILVLIAFFLAVNVQAVAEWKKEFTNK
jgi:hypothetical protein